LSYQRQIVFLAICLSFRFEGCGGSLAHALRLGIHAAWLVVCRRRSAPTGLGCLPEVSELCVESAPECRPGSAPLDVSGKALVARHDLGVAQDA
jgi:hypothetical protein